MQSTTGTTGPCPGDGFLHRPALIPARQSLLALTRPLTAASLTQLLGDPAAVLLLLSDDLRSDNLASLATRPEPLQRALELLADPNAVFLDPAHPVVAKSRAIADRASELAEATNGRVDPLRARICGLLAPLGEIAIATHSPGAWNLDADAIARRLVRRWGLPGWVRDVVGRLTLNADLVADLGGSRAIFDIVRQSTDAVPTTPPTWTDPRGEDLLPDLLRLAIENRLLAGNFDPIRDLEEENDRLHRTLAHRLVEEDDRLRTGRLQALAELAAGAGHEINNPLAVISGQAQYLIGRRERNFTPEAMPQVVQSLETVIGQTRRIHTILRQMMLFARPPVPSRRPVDLSRLVAEVAHSQTEFAALRKIRIEVHATDILCLSVDSEMIRTALTALVRNAIEAAPAEGWVRIGTAQPTPASPVEVVVEDSGPGPLPEQVPFLFDPFYSGRSAGRGKGLGLPVAWQLVRQHGGEVRYVPTASGPTRFVLRLPGTLARADDREASSGEAA